MLIVTGWHGYLPTDCGMAMGLYGHKDAVGLSMSDHEYCISYGFFQ